MVGPLPPLLEEVVVDVNGEVVDVVVEDEAPLLEVELVEVEVVVVGVEVSRK